MKTENLSYDMAMMIGQINFWFETPFRLSIFQFKILHFHIKTPSRFLNLLSKQMSMINDKAIKNLFYLHVFQYFIIFTTNFQKVT